MTAKRRERRALGETLETLDPVAQAFVYQSQPEPEPTEAEEPEAIAPPPEPEPEPEPKAKPRANKPKSRSSFMSSLMESTTEKEATIRLTVDLPEGMHKKLSMLAARTGKKKAEIVRGLLGEALSEID